jgi:hypothetical protein
VVETKTNDKGCEYKVTTITTYVGTADQTINLETCIEAEAGTVVETKTNDKGCEYKVTTITTYVGTAAPTVSITHPTCSVSTGTITVTAPLGIGLTYSINGSTYQSMTTFSSLAAGSYYVTVKNASGCVSAQTIAVINAQPTDCATTSGIFHTQASCSDFQAGGNGYQLSQLCYTTKSNKVFNVTPGMFFYYTTITAPSKSFCVDVVQTRSNLQFKFFGIQQNNQIILWDANCTKVATGTTVTVGQGRICISNATPGAKYVLSVKYDSKSVIGSSYTGSAPSVLYTFESKINGAPVSGSKTSINLLLNCNNVLAISSEEITTDLKETNLNEFSDLKVYPNPFNDRLRFEFISPESVNARIDLYDITGRMVKTIFEAPVNGGVINEAEFKPETIISGMYIYRVTLGESVYNGKVVFKKE